MNITIIEEELSLIRDKMVDYNNTKSDDNFQIVINYINSNQLKNIKAKFTKIYNDSIAKNNHQIIDMGGFSAREIFKHFIITILIK